MGIRDILVHLDGSAAAEARLDLAILYARKHGACLRGLYAMAHGYYQSSAIGEESSRERVETSFREKTEGAGLPSEWLFADSPLVGRSVADIVTKEAYYSDLVVVGQTNHLAPVLNVPTDLPEHLVIACGRPVLVVPYAGSFQSAADRIMFAWKAGRESVRTLHDAMPLVEKSQRLTLVEVTSEPVGPDSDGNFAGVHRYLARHKVAATSDEICIGNQALGDAILNLACERAADLLVVGAHAPTHRGGSGFSILAQHILRHLTVPILLSH